MSYYRQQLETWLKTINVNSDRVIDIGGASNPASSRINSFKAEETIYLDNGKEEARTPYIEFDINEVYGDSIGGFPVKRLQANTLFCLEVFEYVWNPVRAMQNIYNLMGHDSVAYISFPAIYPVHNPVDIDYLRYTKEAIKKYLGMFNFQQIEIIPRVATEGRGSLAVFYVQEGMHPVRKSELPFDIGYLVKARKL